MPIRTGYRVQVNSSASMYTADLADILVPREYFQEGNLWMWGFGEMGADGQGVVVFANPQYSLPVQTIAGGSTWKQVAGYNNCRGIKSDGTLWVWGSNSYGQLGTNTSFDTFYSPVQTVSGGTNWRQVSAGQLHTAAIKTDGTLWTWGYNGDDGAGGGAPTGQLGDNTRTNRSSPVQTAIAGKDWKSVECGYFHTLAIKVDGTLWSWGYNSAGQLGHGDIVSRSTPTQITGYGNSWKSLVKMSSITSGAITNNGSLYLWGDNNYGQYGDSTNISRSVPVLVGAANEWASGAVSSNHFLGIKLNGTLWGSGYNYYGQLGTNNTTWYSSLVQIGTGTNWKKITAANSASAGIKTDGTIWGWGWNSYGNIGDGTVVGKSSPVQAGNSSNDWVDVSFRNLWVMAIKDRSSVEG